MTPEKRLRAGCLLPEGFASGGRSVGVRSGRGLFGRGRGSAQRHPGTPAPDAPAAAPQTLQLKPRIFAVTAEECGELKMKYLGENPERKDFLVSQVVTGVHGRLLPERPAEGVQLICPVHESIRAVGWDKSRGEALLWRDSDGKYVVLDGNSRITYLSWYHGQDAKFPGVVLSSKTPMDAALAIAHFEQRLSHEFRPYRLHDRFMEVWRLGKALNTGEKLVKQNIAQLLSITDKQAGEFIETVEAIGSDEAADLVASMWASKTGPTMHGVSPSGAMLRALLPLRDRRVVVRVLIDKQNTLTGSNMSGTAAQVMLLQLIKKKREQGSKQASWIAPHVAVAVNFLLFAYPVMTALNEMKNEYPAAETVLREVMASYGTCKMHPIMAEFKAETDGELSQDACQAAINKHLNIAEPPAAPAVAAVAQAAATGAAQAAVASVYDMRTRGAGVQYAEASDDDEPKGKPTAAAAPRQKHAPHLSYDMSLDASREVMDKHSYGEVVFDFQTGLPKYLQTRNGALQRVEDVAPELLNGDLVCLRGVVNRRDLMEHWLPAVERVRQEYLAASQADGYDYLPPWGQQEGLEPGWKPGGQGATKAILFDRGEKMVMGNGWSEGCESLEEEARTVRLYNERKAMTAVTKYFDRTAAIEQLEKVYNIVEQKHGGRDVAFEVTCWTINWQPCTPGSKDAHYNLHWDEARRIFEIREGNDGRGKKIFSLVLSGDAWVYICVPDHAKGGYKRVYRFLVRATDMWQIDGFLRYACGHAVHNLCGSADERIVINFRPGDTPVVDALAAGCLFDLSNDLPQLLDAIADDIAMSNLPMRLARVAQFTDEFCDTTAERVLSNNRELVNGGKFVTAGIKQALVKLAWARNVLMKGPDSERGVCDAYVEGVLGITEPRVVQGWREWVEAQRVRSALGPGLSDVLPEAEKGVCGEQDSDAAIIDAVLADFGDNANAANAQAGTIADALPPAPLPAEEVPEAGQRKRPLDGATAEDAAAEAGADAMHATPAPMPTAHKRARRDRDASEGRHSAGAAGAPGYDEEVTSDPNNDLLRRVHKQIQRKGVSRGERQATAAAASPSVEIVYTTPGEAVKMRNPTSATPLDPLLKGALENSRVTFKVQTGDLEVAALDISTAQDNAFINGEVVMMMLNQFMQDLGEAERDRYLVIDYSVFTLLKDKFDRAPEEQPADELEYYAEPLSGSITKLYADAFTKDVIILPMCTDLHWTVVFICNSRALLQPATLDAATRAPDPALEHALLPAPAQSPTPAPAPPEAVLHAPDGAPEPAQETETFILFMDSLRRRGHDFGEASLISRLLLASMCRVLQTSMSPKDVLAATSEDRVQAFRVPVPMQVNGTDCAGFVMASVELFTQQKPELLSVSMVKAALADGGVGLDVHGTPAFLGPVWYSPQRGMSEMRMRAKMCWLRQLQAQTSGKALSDNIRKAMRTCEKTLQALTKEREKVEKRVHNVYRSRRRDVAEQHMKPDSLLQGMDEWKGGKFQWLKQ